MSGLTCGRNGFNLSRQAISLSSKNIHNSYSRPDINHIRGLCARTETLSIYHVDTLFTAHISQQQYRQKSTSSSNSSNGGIESKAIEFRKQNSVPNEIDILNGPPSTLPAKLNSPPPRNPEDSIFKYYFNLGKSYLSFYKTGMKNAAYVNVQLASPLLRRWKAEGGLEGARKSAWLNRSELQLIRRRNHDFKRLPIFGLLFIVCGEFTPFVVLAFSNIVPYTCRIPKQIQVDRQRLQRRREESFKLLLGGNQRTEKIQSIEKLSRMELYHCSNSLGLHSSMWPSRLLPLPLPASLRHRLKQHLMYLDVDDMAILRCGGVKNLNAQELELALIERGMTTINTPETKQREMLSNWLNNRKDLSEEYVLRQWLNAPTDSRSS